MAEIVSELIKEEALSKMIKTKDLWDAMYKDDDIYEERKYSHPKMCTL